MLAEVRAAGRDDCSSWADWFGRLGGAEAWNGAEETAREESANWGTAEFADAAIAKAAGAALLTAAGNANADQVRLTST